MIRYVYSPKYELDLGEHVFPTAKYRLVRDRLLAEGLAAADQMVEPRPASREDLLLVHTSEYLDDLERLQYTYATLRSEVPLTREIVEASMLTAGGTYDATRLAVEAGVGVHLGGGFHHAFPDHAEGFCYINDIAVAIRMAQRDGLAGRFAVIDCDLHQGNGTAWVFRTDQRVFTFSIHQEDNYPVKQRSSLDIGLDDGVGDDEYLGHLATHVPWILSEHRPQAAIYLAGADPFENDQLGGLKLTTTGLAERDRLVLAACREARVPVVVLLAGGYAFDLNDTVTIHCNTCRAVHGVFCSGTA